LAAHLSAQYKFNQSTGSANTAYEVSFGGDYAGFSADVYYTKIKDAVALGALSAGQVADLPLLCPNPLPAGGSCVAANPSNALTATVSDNTAYAFMGLYNMGVLKFFRAATSILNLQIRTPPWQPGFDVARLQGCIRQRFKAAQNPRTSTTRPAGVLGRRKVHGHS